MKILFFSRQHNDYVVDEMCACGHLKSEHGSLLHKLKNKMLREHSDGNCCAGHCECTQFTFARFVTAKEAAKLTISKRPIFV